MCSQVPMFPLPSCCSDVVLCVQLCNLWNRHGYFFGLTGLLLPQFKSLMQEWTKFFDQFTFLGKLVEYCFEFFPEIFSLCFEVKTFWDSLDSFGFLYSIYIYMYICSICKTEQQIHSWFHGKIALEISRNETLTHVLSAIQFLEGLAGLLFNCSQPDSIHIFF